MKKRLAIILSLVALAAALFALAIPAMAAEDESEDLSYVVLGSSQTNGYGLRGYVDERFYQWNGSQVEVQAWNANPFSETLSSWNPHYRFNVSVSGYRNLVAGSYPALVAQYLEGKGYNVTTHQLALSSMRAEELTVLLDNDYYGDEFTDWRFSEDGDYQWFKIDGGLDNLRADYQSTVADADIITYDLGANNFGCYLANQIANPDSYTTDLNNVIDSEYASFYYETRAEVESYILSLVGDSISQADLDLVNNALDAIAYATLGFIKHFDRNMELIYAANPDVDVTVVSIQNSLQGFTIDLSGTTLDMGAITAIPINIANLYAACQSPYCEKYTYADVTSSSGHVTNYINELLTYSGPEDLTQNIIDCLNVYDNHLFLGEKVSQTLEAQGFGTDVAEKSDLYQRAQTAAQDTAMQILKAAASVSPVDVAGIYEGDASAVLYIMIEASVQAAMAGAAGQDYSAVIAQALEAFNALSSADQGAAAFNVWVDFGNSFFAHPSPAGSQELANTITSAMENNTSGYLALHNAIKKGWEDWIGYEEPAHVHSPRYVDYVEASCTSQGCCCYWKCDDCGACFYDCFCLAEIIDMSTLAIPASHYVLHVPADEATYLLPGNIEYYYCVACGTYFADKNLTQRISKLDTIVPCKLLSSSKTATKSSSKSSTQSSSSGKSSSLLTSQNDSKSSSKSGTQSSTTNKTTTKSGTSKSGTSKSSRW